LSYQSLYRRWRPMQFSEVVGQEHITRTLQNAIARHNVSHAYLFCGPRGTGKTTVAKILARAANCNNLTMAEPCGECDSCQQILTGSSMDVFELDAASNRGIDEVRDLRERTRYAPSEGQNNVYIIDEVHMLTQEAFNALLKTLEEPPSGVLFILATTEPYKLPSTVVSRCQRLDFRLLTASEVKERLKEIASVEEWNYEEEAIALIAQLSEGAIRDALGLLEQACAFGEGHVTAEMVYTLAGLAREETVKQMVEALAEEDIVKGLKVIRDVTFGGKDLYLFLKEQILFLKQLLVAQAAGPDVIEEQRYRESALEYKDRFHRNSLLEMISILHQASGEIRFTEHAHFILEIAFLNLLRAAKAASDGVSESLEEKAEKIEDSRAFKKERKDNGDLSSSEQTGHEDHQNLGERKESNFYEDDDPPGEEVSNNEDEAVSSTEQGEPATTEKMWALILESFQKDQSTLALLQSLRVKKMENNIFYVSCEQNKYHFIKKMFADSSKRRYIEKEASEVAGKDIRLMLVSSDGQENDNSELNSESGKVQLEKNVEESNAEKPHLEKTLQEDNQSKEVGEPEENSLPYDDLLEGQSEQLETKDEDVNNKNDNESSRNFQHDEVIIKEALRLFEGSEIIENEN